MNIIQIDLILLKWIGMRNILPVFFQFVLCTAVTGQHISAFTSVTPGSQTSDFKFPFSTHTFQKILEHGDPVLNGTARDNFDFTGYLPANGSSVSGYLSLNHEMTPGGVTAMDMHFNAFTKLWQAGSITNLDFTAVNGTAKNCSGGITPWGTTITCEEGIDVSDTNLDGYNDLGWMVEVDPVSKTVIGKLWALGCGKKENIVIHANRQTAYFGNDDNPGYLFKFVASSVNNLNSGLLYAYKGSKNGTGEWIPISNATIWERNNTMQLCNAAGATVFNGIEDVEIGPDGKVYLAVKNESCVYRFTDIDPITGKAVSGFETYAGNRSYNISHEGGTVLTPWGSGNDNLAFDNLGNLWVLQDGGKNYIWVVMNNHTQESPNVKLFGIAPAGSEPTGITFTPDFKYLFMSFQHPNAANGIDFQIDAAGNPVGFGKDIALVISLSADLGCNEGIPPVTWYRDSDKDSWGNSAVSIVSCTKPAGYVSNPGDCRDNDNKVYPGAIEICDGKDNDCNGLADDGIPQTPWYRDADNDTWGNTANIKMSCFKPTGYVNRPGDCSDRNNQIYPDAPELCDGNDNNCNGQIDEGLPGTTTWYRDGDGDGYGRAIGFKVFCSPTGFVPGYSNIAGDCNDTKATIYPGVGTCPALALPFVAAATGKYLMQAYIVDEQKPEVLIFPNPAHSRVTVTLNAFVTGKKVEIVLMGADGKVQQSLRMMPVTKGQQVPLNTGRLPEGYYIILVKQGALQQTKMLVIAR